MCAERSAEGEPLPLGRLPIPRVVEVGTHVARPGDSGEQTEDGEHAQHREHFDVLLDRPSEHPAAPEVEAPIHVVHAARPVTRHLRNAGRHIVEGVVVAARQIVLPSVDHVVLIEARDRFADPERLGPEGRVADPVATLVLRALRIADCRIEVADREAVAIVLRAV